MKKLIILSLLTLTSMSGTAQAETNRLREGFYRLATGEQTCEIRAVGVSSIKIRMWQTATPAPPADKNNWYHVGTAKLLSDGVTWRANNSDVDGYCCGNHLQFDFRVPSPTSLEMIRWRYWSKNSSSPGPNDSWGTNTAIYYLVGATPGQSVQHNPQNISEPISGIESIGLLLPINFELRYKWIVREHLPNGRVMEGVWIRRGTSPIFDATWRLESKGKPKRDVVTVRGVYDSNVVEVHSKAKGGTYLGPLKADKRGVERGTASWYGNEWWEATFVDRKPPVNYVHHNAGSHLASVGVICLKGSEIYKNNWVRSCILVGDQTFQRITFRNPGQPPTTTPVLVQNGVMVEFDEYGNLVFPKN